MGDTMMSFFRLILTVFLFAVNAGVQAEMQGMLHDHGERNKENSPAHCEDPSIGAEAKLKELRPLAAKGDAHAQYEIGFMYDRGLGVPQDFKEAALWYRKAAEQGNASAQFYLGQIYDLGKSVATDYNEAAVWYRKAAEQGESLAQLNLGFLYEQGQGVPVDMVQAYKWYSLAAATGNEIAPKSKEDVEARMSSVEIKKAQALEREWLAQHHK